MNASREPWPGAHRRRVGSGEATGLHPPLRAIKTTARIKSRAVPTPTCSRQGGASSRKDVAEPATRDPATDRRSDSQQASSFRDVVSISASGTPSGFERFGRSARHVVLFRKRMAGKARYAAAGPAPLRRAPHPSLPGRETNWLTDDRPSRTCCGRRCETGVSRMGGASVWACERFRCRRNGDGNRLIPQRCLIGAGRQSHRPARIAVSLRISCYCGHVRSPAESWLAGGGPHWIQSRRQG